MEGFKPPVEGVVAVFAIALALIAPVAPRDVFKDVVEISVPPPEIMSEAAPSREGILPLIEEEPIETIRPSGPFSWPVRIFLSGEALDALENASVARNWSLEEDASGGRFFLTFPPDDILDLEVMLDGLRPARVERSERAEPPPGPAVLEIVVQ